MTGSNRAYGWTTHNSERPNIRPEFGNRLCREFKWVRGFLANTRLNNREIAHEFTRKRGEYAANTTKGRPAPLRASVRATDQRLENWNERRALARPYFLRSTTRASRVRKPPRLSTPRRSGSNCVSALEMP